MQSWCSVRCSLSFYPSLSYFLRRSIAYWMRRILLTLQRLIRKMLILRFLDQLISTPNLDPSASAHVVLGLRPEMLKMSFLRPVLARFWAWDQKCSKWASCMLFKHQWRRKTLFIYNNVRAYINSDLRNTRLLHGKTLFIYENASNRKLTYVI